MYGYIQLYLFTLYFTPIKAYTLIHLLLSHTVVDRKIGFLCKDGTTGINYEFGHAEEGPQFGVGII